MINPINNNSNFSIGSNFNTDKKSVSNDTASFVDMLKNNFLDTNQSLKGADQVSEAFALGKIENIHEVTIATENAKVALNLTLAVQNKVMEAYKEIMRLQI